MFCNGGNPSSTCKCQKLVRTYAMYESEVLARAQLLGGLWTKEATAAAEDFAIAYTLTKTGVAKGKFTLLGAGVTRAQNTCSRSPNPEFWSLMATYVADFTKFLVAAAEGGTALEALFKEDVLSQLLQKRVDLALTPSRISSGTCGQDLELAKRLIEEEVNVWLDPNMPTEIGIATRSRLYSTGKRAWQSTAVLKSGYILATVENTGAGSTSTNDLACCTNYTSANYMAKAVEGKNGDGKTLRAINDTYSLREEAASIIILKANSRFNFDVTLTLPPLLGGGTIINTITPFEAGRSIARDRYTSTCKIPTQSIVSGEPDSGEDTGRQDSPSTSDDNASKSFNNNELIIYSVNGRAIGATLTNVFEFNQSLVTQFPGKLKSGLLYVAVIRDVNSGSILGTTKFIHQ